MNGLMSIEKAARTLGLCITSRRRWDLEGKLITGLNSMMILVVMTTAKLKPELIHVSSDERPRMAYANDRNKC